MSTINFPTTSTEQKYTERLKELTQFCLEQYGVEERVTRIIAACLIPTTPTHPCWLICDSPRHLFWDHLHSAIVKFGYLGVENAYPLRTKRPYYANIIIDRILDARTTPMLFLDHNWEHSHHAPNFRSRYPDLESECMRVQIPISWSTMPQNGADKHLFELLKLVVDAEHRPFFPVPIPKPPELMKFAVNLAQLGNAGMIYPYKTLHNTLIFTSANAVLHGRDHLTEDDHEQTYFLLRNSMRYASKRVLEAIAAEDGALTEREIEIRTQIHPGVMQKECARLCRAAILRKKGRYIGWGEGIGEDMRIFMRGEMRWW